MDWIMYTAGVVFHIWVILVVIGVVQIFNDPRVKAGHLTPEFNSKIYIPFIGLLAFWMWIFFG